MLSLTNSIPGGNPGSSSPVSGASLNPARAVGRERDLGSLEEGKKADLIAIDNNFNVVFTMIGGKVLFSSQEVIQ